MLNKILRKLKGKKTKSDIYREVSAREAVDASLALLEGGQGKNHNGNMFFLLKELEDNPMWKDITPIYVATKENIEETKDFLRGYNFTKVKVVVRNSESYAKYLATAKYLFTDNSFPIYMVKREEQVYVNTWHGTPIKHLGVSDLANATSLPNVQKNYFMCDYALFPNEHTKDVFLHDYNLKNYMTGKCLMCDYPRNDAFHEATPASKEIHKIAYMPTWRGSGRNANVQEQKNIVMEFLSQMDEKLRDNQILYVNFHFLVGNDLDFTQYKHIECFPAERETYDFLKECDMLISDYSSVVFDFAVSKKPMVLYAYDREDYEQSKGTYLSIDDLGIPIVSTVEDLIHQINQKQDINSKKLLDEFAPYRAANTSQKLLEFIILGQKDNLKVEEPRTNQRKNVYVYGDTLGSEYQQKALVHFLEGLDLENNNVMLGFKGKLTRKNVEFLTKDIPDEVMIHGLVNQYTFTRNEKIYFWIRKRFERVACSVKMRCAMELQRKRLLGNMQIDEFVQFAVDGEKMVDVFSTLPCKKSLYLFPFEIVGFKRLLRPFSFNEKVAKQCFDEVIDVKDKDFSKQLICEEEEREVFYNDAVKYNILSEHNFWNQQGLTVFGFFSCISGKSINQKEVWMEVKGEKVQSKIFWKNGIPGRHHKRIHMFMFKVPFAAFEEMGLNNKVRFCWQDEKGLGYKKRSIFGRKKNTYKISSVKIAKNINRTIYFRATDIGSYVLVVRPINYTDQRAERIKLFLASLVAKFVKNKNYITLFEKNSARYEESASVLYEKLIDAKYHNVNYILEKSYFDTYKNHIEKKYQQNMVEKFSFRHYVLFFASQTFISSESVGHALEIRCCSKAVRKRLIDKTFNYVFLQHGVMYMISLDSDARKMFNQLPKKAKNYRVVVSSDLEAEHFIELGNHEEKHIYVTGLCKFDQNQWKQDANRIVIMPTWRPWEYNEAESDLTQTNYYKMLKRMIDAVPEDLKEKLYILPHPLIAEHFRETEKDLAKYLPDPILKYDTILEETKLLITDYSSISYDAFYRGANIIFYWEELNECLEAYGANTKLMLNQDNVFGEICYNKEELCDAINFEYSSPQSDDYIVKYNQIVSFHDGKNTQRVIECLKKDKFI